MLKNILVLVSNENINQNKNKLINKFSNLLLIISSNEQFENDLLNNEEFLNKLIEIFKNIIPNKESISFNSQISLGTFLIKIIQQHNSFKHQAELFQFITELLNNSINLMAKQLDDEEIKNSNFNLEKRLIIVNLLIIISMLQKEKQENFRYIKILKYSGINDQLFNLMVYFLRKEFHLDLAQKISSFFVILTNFPSGANQLENMNIVNRISMNFRLTSKLFTVNCQMNNVNHIIFIFSQLIRIMINMMIHLKHYFTESCVSFVAIYMDTFKEIFTEFRQQPKINISNLVLLILELCSSLSKYIRTWENHHLISLQMITHEILLLSNIMVAFINRPLIIKTFEDEYKQLTNTNSIKATGYDNFQALFLQMLFNSIKFLLDVSPNFAELFENETISTEKYQLLISTNFSMPNTETEILSFGSLVNLINSLIRIIYKVM